MVLVENPVDLCLIGGDVGNFRVVCYPSRDKLLIRHRTQLAGELNGTFLELGCELVEKHIISGIAEQLEGLILELVSCNLRNASKRSLKAVCLGNPPDDDFLGGLFEFLPGDLLPDPCASP